MFRNNTTGSEDEACRIASTIPDVIQELLETIDRLDAQLDEKNAEIENLRTEVEYLKERL